MQFAIPLSFFLALPALSSCTGSSSSVGPTVSGTLLDYDERSVPDVRVLDGASRGSGTTNLQGRFQVPTVPEPHVLRVLAGPDTPETPIPVNAFDPDGTTELGPPLFLPRLDRSRAIPVPVPPLAQELRVTDPGLPGVELVVPAGTTVTFPSGTDRTLQIFPTAVDRPPLSLPDGRATRMLFGIEPMGVTFAPAALLELPNADGMTPGATVDLHALDPETGAWTPVGALIVSADGERLEGAEAPFTSFYAALGRPRPPTATLTGSVVAPGGQPREGIFVVGPQSRFTTTDAAGRFVLDGIPATLGDAFVRLVTPSTRMLEVLRVGPIAPVADEVLDLGTFELESRPIDRVVPEHTLSFVGQSQDKVPVNTRAFLVFSEAVDPRTVDPKSLRLSFFNTKGQKREVPGGAVLTPDLGTIAFVPEAQLEPEAPHRFRIASTIGTLDGNRIAPGKDGERLEFDFTSMAEAPPPTTPTFDGAERLEVIASQELVLRGFGFQGNTEITIGGTPATVVAENTFQVTVLVPDREAARDLAVEGTFPGGTVAKERSVSVSILPALERLTPATLDEAGGSLVAVEGQGLGTADLDFNGVLVSGVVADDLHHLMVTAPARAWSGPLQIEVPSGASTIARSPTPLFYLTTKAVDVVPPFVTAVSPDDGAIDVDRASTVEVTLSEPVDTRSFFSVVGPAGNVAGAVQVVRRSDGTFAAIFTPEALLDPSTTYMVLVAGGVADLSDNVLDQDPSTPGPQGFASAFVTVP